MEGVEPFESALKAATEDIAAKNDDLLRHAEHLKTEKNRLHTNNEVLKENTKRYYDMAYHLLVEVAIQSEINQRLHSILEGALSHLPSEKQVELAEDVAKIASYSTRGVEDYIATGDIKVEVNSNVCIANENFTEDHFVGKYLLENADKGHPIDHLLTAMSIQSKRNQSHGPAVRQLMPRSESNAHFQSNGIDDANQTQGFMMHNEYPHDEVEPPIVGTKAEPFPEVVSAPRQENGPIGHKKSPSQLVPYKTFYHGEVVCAVAMSKDTRTVYTGGKGCVKVWDMTAHPQTLTGPHDTHTYDTPVVELDCMYDNYIRACKLMPDGYSLIVGGEANELTLWDIGAPQPRMTGLLKSEAPACYALAVTSPGGASHNPLCISGCSDGVINVWDVHNQQLLHSFMGHREGVSCVDVFKDGHSIVTGGLDHFVRIWDLRMYKQVDNVPFSSPVFSVGTGPDKWLAAGLENHEIRIFSANKKDLNHNFAINKHTGSVLSLKFAQQAPWLLTTGKDSWLNIFRVPQGVPLAEYRESMSILCSDMSMDDNLVVVGSGDQFSRVFRVR
eukprot:CFRG3579T1